MVSAVRLTSLHTVIRRIAFASVAVTTLLSALPASAQQCSRVGCGRLTMQCGGTPARPVPQALWGELQAVDPNPLPLTRDTTAFNEFAGDHYGSKAWYVSMDAEGGYLFAGLAHGFSIWDARSNPASPTLVSEVKANSYVIWNNNQEIKWPLHDADAPDENSIATVGEGGIGLAIFDTTNKSNPRLVYQNHDKDGKQVYTTILNGTRYAFMATPVGASAGLLAFNMSQALQAANPCIETTPGPGTSVSCPGVYLGKVGSRTSVRYIHGVDHFLALSSGATRGVEIYDISNPANAQLKLTGMPNNPVFGVAMWKQGSSYYLGAVTQVTGLAQLRIYDVSCIAGSGTCSLGGEVSTGLYNTGDPNVFLTFSRNGSTPFLYIGSENRCGNETLQREFLLDVTNPASPHDITPAPGLVNGLTTGYWGWYYRPNPTGFNNVMAREGVFVGDYFYRAAFSIFDIHKRTGGSPPSADFDWTPTEVYPNVPVTFTDRSLGGVNSRSWSFQDGTPASSTSASQAVSFSSIGSKTVSLTVNNAVGSDVRTKNVNVLNPVPQVGGVQVSPGSPLLCQPVTLSGIGVTGAPTLSYSWEIKNETTGLPVIPANTQPSFSWLTGLGGVVPGSYRATLTVTNSAGSGSASTVFNLGALPILPVTGSFAPTHDPFTSGTVQFHVNAPGATEWSWDFGDDAGFGPWSNDPLTGPNPTKTYTSIGTKNVKVRVRNCLDPNGSESSVLTVNITQTTPLTAGFQAIGGVFCSGVGCTGTTNSPITFANTSEGPPDRYEYDWNGNGTFVSSPTPITTHTYTAEGTVTPTLRVWRGTEASELFVHRSIFIGSGSVAPNPSISVSGSSSGTVGQSYTFSASASNCSPTSTWSWTTDGGTVSGSSTGSSISVSWATAGSKTVRASNSGCGSTSGSRSINISNGSTGNPNDPLTARFTVTPTSARAGEAVSFNASTSAGSPVTYAWNFGDGSEGTGLTASHTYAAAGSYTVRLTITKSGTGANCFFGTCAADTTQVVVITSGGPALNGAFSISGAECIQQFGFNQCSASTGQTISFEAAEANASSYTWTFGDGTTATGRNVTHAFNNSGSFAVVLTVSNGSSQATSSRTFNVAGEPVSSAPAALLLPWIAQSSTGGLLQSTDFYAFNPGNAAMTLKVKFLKRGGTSDPNAPTVERVIGPGATLFQQNALQTLFNQPDTAGFLYFTWEGGGGTRPVVASINRTFVGTNSFRQAVPAIPIARLEDTGATATPPQNLIGLNDNPEKLSYFGVTNPYPQNATVRFKFFDRNGQPIGQESTLTISGFSQKQFQPAEIRNLGVRGDDYRVLVETLAGGPVYAFGSTVRLGTGDPSFVPAGDPGQQKVYLLGAMSQPTGGGRFRTDLVLYNPTNQVIITDLTYRNVGFTSVPTDTVTVTLAPGETRRLPDVVFNQWRVVDAVGLLTVDSDSPTSQYLVVYGETYEDTNPGARYGQTMSPLSAADLAKVGQTQVMTGLIDNSSTRTVLWFYNPTAENALVDVTFRGMDGRILGTRTDYLVGPGVSRQLSNGTHPIPANFQESFTVEVKVTAGSVLTAAQVILNSNNDPTYIPGQNF